jgi:hypothetical protein
MFELPPEDDEDYDAIELTNSLIEAKNFDSSKWYDLLALNTVDWSEEQEKAIELHLKSRLGETKYHEFLFSWCTLCEDGYDNQILSYVRSEIRQNKDSEKFIALFKRIVSKTIQAPEESEIFLSWGPLYSNEVIWALMRAWKLEDEEKGKELFESLGQDFQSFLKEDAEIDGVYIG